MDQTSLRSGDVPMIPASSLVLEDTGAAEPTTYRGQVRQTRIQRDRETAERLARERRIGEREELVQRNREVAATIEAAAAAPSSVPSTVTVVPPAANAQQPHQQPSSADPLRGQRTMQVYGEAQRASEHPPPIVLPAASVSTYNERLHLRRVMRVIAASCPVDQQMGTRRWFGLKTFLNYYFASNLKLFLGRRSVVRVFLITTEHDLCAKLYRMDGNRYVLSLVANFEYWDQMLGIACALPDVYFSTAGSVGDTTRTYLRQMRGATAAADAGFVDPWVSGDMLGFYDTTQQNPPERDDTVNEWPLDRAVAALCLAHLFETMISRDLKNKLPQYVTLAQLFTRDPQAVNPFRVELRCR